MSAFVPNSHELAEALPHIRHEVSWFFATPKHDRSDFHVVEVILFARMAHARALVDFFCRVQRRDDPKDDDILASDYGFVPSSKLFDEQELVFVKQRINKHLMHLTFSRVHLPGDQKLWPVDRIFAPIERRCLDFVRFVLSLGSVAWPNDEKAKWELLKREIAGRAVSVEATENVVYETTSIRFKE